MNRLIFADVDGTILRHHEKEVTERVTEAVARMHEAGDILVPVTSRTAKMMGSLATQLSLRHAGVLDGGASIFDFATATRDDNLSRWVSPEKTSQVLQAIGQYCTEVFYGEDSLMHQEGSRPDRSSPSIFAVYPNDRKAHVAQALSRIAGVSGHHNDYEDAGTHGCVQVVRNGVSKRSGVAALLAQAQYAGFAPRDIVAIGDGSPDRDLMLAVPDGAHRIAVGNNRDLREVGAVIVPPASQDGFAIAMERYVLD